MQSAQGSLLQRSCKQQLRAFKAAPAARASRSSSVRVQASGSTYGTVFRVTTFGESHGKGVGCVVDGVPPRLAITEEEIQFELDRRRPGQSIITTPRKEEDTCEILSGVGDGVTLGTPIAVVVRNKDQRSGDYSEMSVAYRPSHADATYDFKYGIRAVAGGGRSSARETIGRVAAGAIAKKLLKVVCGTEVRAGRAARRAAAPCSEQRAAAARPGRRRRKPPPQAPALSGRAAAAADAAADPGVREPRAGHRLRGGQQHVHAGGRGEQHRALPRPGGRAEDDRRCAAPCALGCDGAAMALRSACAAGAWATAASRAAAAMPERAAAQAGAVVLAGAGAGTGAGAGADDAGCSSGCRRRGASDSRGSSSHRTAPQLRPRPRPRLPPQPSTRCAPVASRQAVRSRAWCGAAPRAWARLSLTSWRRSWPRP
jgi:hypothetical protein